MSFTIMELEHFKNIFHLNLIANKDHYLKDKIYRFPPYHGCGLKNRNGTNKLIDYKRGHQCLFPTEKHYWRSCKTLLSRPKGHLIYMRYLTNLGINEFAKTRKREWYDWNKKCYISRKKWFRNEDPFFRYNIITP